MRLTVRRIYRTLTMTEKAKSCCFTGHREIPQELTGRLMQRLKAGIDYLYTNTGVTTYYTGGALGFDTLAAQAVIDRHRELTDIRLVLVIPCADQAARWNNDAVAAYERIKASADEVICLAEHYYRGCMHQRNRYMADHSAACICYLTKDTGGTAYTVQYARKNGLKIYNLAKEKTR